MDAIANTTQIENNVSDVTLPHESVLRALASSEVMLIGGGDISITNL